MSMPRAVRVYSCWMLITSYGWNGLNMPENSRHWNSPPPKISLISGIIIIVMLVIVLF